MGGGREGSEGQRRWRSAGERERDRGGERLRVRERGQGVSGRLQTRHQAEGRASSVKQEVAIAAHASTRTCSYWQEEDDAVGWWAGLSTVLGHSWAD